MWEHARLLSDSTRNARLVELLRRHAPGATVLEVGCGTGLLSCVAARLGARRVIAVEPTEVVEQARALVAANGLGGIVEVRRGLIEELEPEPVDLAFSELLNADPFVEGILPAMDAAARWVRPGGRCAPRRLRVWTALVRVSGSAREAAAAAAEVRALGTRHGLDVGPIVRSIEGLESYAYMTAPLAPVSGAALVYDLAIGRGDAPGPMDVELVVSEAGPIGGAIVWFEAELDDGLVLDNAGEGHWGQLCCAWASERGARAGERLSVRVTPTPGGLRVERREGAPASGAA